MSETTMNCDYTDEDGDDLHVTSSSRPGHVLVNARRSDGESATVRIPGENAPALALAILEAAGLADDPWSETCAAIRALQRHERVRAEKVEQEAEDTKVCDYFELVNDGVRPAWSEIPEHRKRDCRAEYRRAKRAAREFFTCDEDGVSTEDLAEALGHKLPRVLQYGDPEPDHSTAWVDRDGDTWKHGEDPDDGHLGWRWIDRGGEIFPARDWSRIGSRMFPLTEVTE